MSEQKEDFAPKRAMLRLFAYLGNYRSRLIFSVSTSVINKVLDLMPPVLVAWIVDTLGGKPPKWMAGLVPEGDTLAMAVLIGVLAVVIFGLESFFEWLYRLGFLTLAQKVQHDLRVDAYRKLQDREMAYFEDHRTGESMAILNDDVNQLERFLNDGFNEILHLIVLFSFSGVVLFESSWRLALIGLAPIPLILLGSFYYQRIITPRYKKVRESVGQLSSRLENNISGISVIKSFSAEAFESGRVEEASETYKKANFRAISLSTLFVPLIRMLIAIGFGGVLLAGSYWVLEGMYGLTVGELVLFSMLIQRVLWPVVRLGQVMDEYSRAKVSAQRVFGLMDSVPKVRDKNNARAVVRAKGELDFEDVRFGYRADQEVLKGLTLSIRAGETIGVAGTSGAGKSTLVKLLLRFYDVNEGRICLDGADIRDLKIQSLRQNIALVSQDVYLFHGTIRENIAYGRAGVTDEQVEAAARMAQIHAYFSGLPEGYDTLVGERGLKLSGGQRQRLSIARALLKDSPILILDEATSSVDTETERAIKENLDRFTAGRTALLIAHRLSTIRNADRIIVLDKGQVCESGTHDALLAQNGIYADLWRVQTGEVAGHKL